MNWLVLLMRALQLAPVIVAGIEQIHGEKSGATKKQMAMDSLALASGTAGALDPKDQPAIDAASQLTSNVIDGVVDVFNKTGTFGSGGKPAAAAAAVKPIKLPVPVGDNNLEVQALRAAPAPPAPAPSSFDMPAAPITQNRGD